MATVERVKVGELVSAGLLMGMGADEKVHVHGRYKMECFDKDGKLKWTEEFDNLVTTQGKNDLLDKYLSGNAYTAAFYLMLKGTGAAAAGDTYASHAGWAEITSYAAATRPAPTFAAAAAGSKATSAAVSYAINGTATVAGAALVTNSTKGDTAGAGAVLYSAGDFTTARDVINGDTLNVTYTAGA